MNNPHRQSRRTTILTVLGGVLAFASLVAGIVVSPLVLGVIGGASLVCFLAAMVLHARFVNEVHAKTPRVCPRCGYALDGLRAGQGDERVRCPECGGAWTLAGIREYWEGRGS